jgi:hypothetical protein
MSRSLSFALRMENQTGAGPAIRLRTNPGYSAAELAPHVPAGSLQPAFAVFSAVDKSPVAGLVKVINDREFIFPLPAPVASSAWRMAILINLIDNAVFGSEDPGASTLIESVTIESDALAGLSLEALQSALEAKKEEARQEITGLLPPDYKENPDIGREWPADGSDWFFNIELQLDKTIEDTEDCRERLQQVDDMIAWTGFETEKTPIEYLQNGLVPYPAEVSVSETAVAYNAEMPPAATGLPLILMRDILGSHFGSKVIAWKMEISEGW